MLKITCEPNKLGEELIKHIIESRFRQKKNTFFAICGGVGEGKSYTALKIAETIQPDFEVREQVVYYPQQFLEVINKARKGGVKVVVLDEAHVTIPAKLWYSFTNLAVSFVSSTFRQVKNLVVIVVTPNVNWVEKSIREMINYYGVVQRTEDSPVYLKLYKVGFNYFDLKDQNPYLQKIRFIWNGNVYVLGLLKTGLPSERVMNEYEEISTEFKKNLIETQLENTLSKIDRQTKVAHRNIEGIASSLLENPKLLATLSKTSKKGFVLKKLAVKNLFNLTTSDVNALESLLLQKMKELGWCDGRN